MLLVTEFLPGGDLWHALGKPSVSRPIFAWHVWGHKVALDIARGLHFLHSRARPIAHFDLKSHNILLAADGTAKIADVGLARILNQVRVQADPLLADVCSCDCYQQWSAATSIGRSCCVCDAASSCCSTGQATVTVCLVVQEYVSKLDEVAGTFAWAAPELLLGRRCSEKVDIFAFGVVSYSC